MIRRLVALDTTSCGSNLALIGNDASRRRAFRREGVEKVSFGTEGRLFD